MRTTLDIEEDVLQAAKELAAREGSTAGRVLSQLARRGLTAPEGRGKAASSVRNGVPIFPPSGQVVTLKKVREIMESDEA